jgi:hypothetical protein
MGANWTGATSGLAVNGNALVPTTLRDASAIWNPTVFAANQEGYFAFTAITARSPEQGLLLKVQGTSFDAGCIEARYEAKFARVRVFTFAPASGWTVRGGPYSATYSAGDRLGARAYANGVVEVYRNGALLGSASVAAWPQAGQGGRIGLMVSAASSSGYDDFGGGNLGTAITPPSAPQAAPSSAFAQLSSAFPNPSGGGIDFTLTLPHAARVAFRVMDLMGRELWSAPVEDRDAGQWTLYWPGFSSAGEAARPGLYLALVNVDGRPITRRMMVTR